MTDEQKQAVESLDSTSALANEAGPDDLDVPTGPSPSQGADGDVNGEPLNGGLDPRHCEHFYGDGRRCKGWKVSGSSYCAGHSGLGVAASPEAAAAAARHSAEVRQMKAQVAKRRPIEVVREGLEADAEAFYRVRREIALDSTAATGDRLRAIEQIESRALGKPKETVETQEVKSEADRALDEMSLEELEALVQRGMHLRAVEDEAAEG